MDFFAAKGHCESDIAAQDFLTDPRGWHTARRSVARPSSYLTYRKAASKLAAHLTYARLKYTASGSPVPSPEITGYLVTLADAMLEGLPEERRAWFRRRPGEP
jgi:hypothetical protein